MVAPSPSILDTIETKYTVVLDSFDAAKKIPVLKAVREITGLGLGESKSLVEGAPKVVKEGVDNDAAEEFVTKITLAGGYATKKNHIFCYCRKCSRCNSSYDSKRFC